MQHLLRRTVGHHGAVEADEPGQVGRETVDVVRGEDDRHAVPVQIGEQVEQLVTRRDVDAAGRFVEHEQVGFLRQRTGEEDPLLLPAGEFADVPVVEPVEPDRVDDPADPVGVGPRQSPEPPVADRQRHHVEHGDGERPVDRLDLGDVADPQPAPTPDRAVPRVDDAEQGLERRGLAAAGGPDDPDEIALVHGEFDVVDHGVDAVPAADVFEHEERGHGRHRRSA